MADELCLPTPRPDVAVWLIDLPARLSPAQYVRCEELLDDQDREAARRFRREAPRHEYVAAHAAVRLMLSTMDPTVRPQDWRFRPGPGGKPVIVDSSMTFSLSHSRGWAAIAVSTVGDVGVDVEPCDRTIEPKTFSTVLAVTELDELNALEGHSRGRRFAQLWTAKEAYAKAIGRGISGELKSVVVETVTHVDGVGTGHLNGLAFWQHVTNDCCVSVVTVRSAMVSIRRISVEAVAGATS